MTQRLLKEIDRRAKVFGLSDIALAKRAGLGRDAVRDIRRRPTTKPGYDTIRAIAKALGCTVDDLTGERPITPIRSRDSVIVFEVNTASVAGVGLDGEFMPSPENAVGEYTFPAAGFRQAFGSAPDGVIIDEVRGDSQVPTLFPGQRVMINTLDRKPTPPGFFLCWDGLGMVLKRIELVPGSDPPTVRLISDNPKYKTYERTLEEAMIFGRVIGTWTRL